MIQTEKFYVRDNLIHRWVANSRGGLTQFSSQRTAKRYADKHLSKFTIISYNHTTKKLKWRGGDRAIQRM